VFFGIGYERTTIKGATAIPQNYFVYRPSSATSAAPCR
jgi:hypothetical protein